MTFRGIVADIQYSIEFDHFDLQVQALLPGFYRMLGILELSRFQSPVSSLSPVLVDPYWGCSFSGTEIARRLGFRLWIPYQHDTQDRIFEDGDVHDGAVFLERRMYSSCLQLLSSSLNSSHGNMSRLGVNMAEQRLLRAAPSVHRVRLDISSQGWCIR